MVPTVLFRFVPAGTKEWMELQKAVEIIVDAVIANDRTGRARPVVGICIGVDEVQKLAGLYQDSAGNDGTAVAISSVLKWLVAQSFGGRAVVCAGVAGTAVHASRYRTDKAQRAREKTVVRAEKEVGN